MAIASGGSGLASWQQGLRWMDDEEEQDSDTDSKLSGSAMVDSVMKRLKKHGNHFNSFSSPGGGVGGGGGGGVGLDPIRDRTLSEEAEEEEEEGDGDGGGGNPPRADEGANWGGGKTPGQSGGDGRYGDGGQPNMSNGYHDNAANRSPSFQRRAVPTSNSPRSARRREYENTHATASSYLYPMRKKELLSPVPETTSSGARVVEISAPPPNTVTHTHRGVPSGGGRNWPVPPAAAATAPPPPPPGTRSMENIPQGTPPGSRRRKMYEHTHIPITTYTEGSAGRVYRDQYHVPPPNDLSSSSYQSRSHEVLPRSVPAKQHGYLEDRDFTASLDHGYQMRRGSSGSGGGGGGGGGGNSHPPHVPGPQLHSIPIPAGGVISIPTNPGSHSGIGSAGSSTNTTPTHAAHARNRSWKGSGEHVPMFPDKRTPPQRRANYARHEIPRDTSHHSNIHNASHGGDGLERSASSLQSKPKEPNLNDVVDFLRSDDPNLVSKAASYLQHLAYGDDSMKSKIRQFGAIPVLVSQLRNADTKVQISILGALRNLSFGRSNDENKLVIANEHGLPEVMLALKMSRVAEVRELLTSLLWNLSSCEELKLRIVQTCLHDLVSVVLVPYCGWSVESARDPLAKPTIVQWNSELRNTTGTLRNLSSAGEPARVFMRSSSHLVDSLFWLLKAGVQQLSAADEKSVENTACILRNLSYRLENEIDPQEGAEDVLDREWELQQRREMEEVNRSFSKATPGCLAFCAFPKMSDERSKLQSVSRPIYSVDFANPDRSSLPKRKKAVYGMALLWQPEVMYLYLAVIEHYSVAVETVEAAAGAIQNLTACNWKWASYSRNIIRTSNGLRLLADLLNNGHDAVVKAAATALRNLAIDPRNKATLGVQAIPSIIPRLPFGSNHLGISEETTIALLCCLMELCSSSPENAKMFRDKDGIRFLTRLTRSRQDTQKVVFAAHKVCSLLYDQKDCKVVLKREGWEIGQYNKMAKDNVNKFDFERVSMSRDYRGSSRKIKKKDSKKHSKKEKRKREEGGANGYVDQTPESVSPVPPSQSGHVTQQSDHMISHDPTYQDIAVGVSTNQKQANPAPALTDTAMGIYQDIKDPAIQDALQQGHTATAHTDTSTTTGTAHSTTGPLSQEEGRGGEEGEEEDHDPNATYASVDIEKKRASRRQRLSEERKISQVAAAVDSWV